MTTTILDEYILPVLVRYIDQYHWSFSIAARLINRYYGTDYTYKQLKKLYQQNQTVSELDTNSNRPSRGEPAAQTRKRGVLYAKRL